MKKKLSCTEALLIMLRGGLVSAKQVSTSTECRLRWYARDNGLRFVDSGCCNYRTYSFD